LVLLSKPFKGFQRDLKRFKGFGEKNYLSFPKSLVAWVSLWLKTGPLGQPQRPVAFPAVSSDDVDALLIYVT
jgi:hypothetical protein